MADRERAAAPRPDDPERRFRHRIEAGVSISGRIHFPEDARIDGQLKGEIRADRLLLVGPTAELEATVSAQHLVLAGTMRGSILRSGTVRLEPTARLVGSVEARNLVVRAGAFFDGRARVGSPTGASAPRANAEPTRPPTTARRAGAGG